MKHLTRRLPLKRDLTALLLLLALAILRATAQAPFTVPGAPAWQWQAPRPAGYDLTDVATLDDQTAVAVGLHGAALKTTDRGLTWNQLYLGIAHDLKAVSFVTPQVGWVAYNTPPANPLSGNGQGELRRTLDGGQTWSTQLIGEADAVDMTDAHFFSPTQGYVFYYYTYAGYNRPARLRVTGNGGLSWTSVNIPAATKAVQLVTPTVGYLTGLGSVLKTTDGGQTFTDVTPPGAMGVELSKISFVDPLHGWVASIFGGSTPNFYRTTDGGATWTAMRVLGPTVSFYVPVYNLAFADDLHGVAGEYVTADGGQTDRKSVV